MIDVEQLKLFFDFRVHCLFEMRICSNRLMLASLLKQNVLLSSPQGDVVLKIADFGLSR